MGHIMPRRQSADEEAVLIRRAKAGDPDAFAQIYNRCQPAIYRYIFFRVHDGALAEDLTSEVFVRLVDLFDHLPFVVGLVALDVTSELQRQLLNLFTDLFQRNRPVMFGVALSEHVQIDTV